MFRSFCIIAILGSVVFSIAGCNVGPMFRDRQTVKGPVTSPTHPDRIDPSQLAMDISVVEAREVDLVEAVLIHRAAYHRHLGQLRDYYKSHGFVTKQSWAEFELKGLGLVKPFKYLLDAEIPSNNLTPTDTIPEADLLFESARDLMGRAGYGMAGFYNQDLMIRACAEFRELIERYPSSDKIDDAAFYLGEIHSDYLPDQAVIAVRWYERAWTWNPDTPHPARYQAAHVYDYQLHNRARALELYHSVIEHETENRINLRTATKRIRKLSTAGSED